MLRALSRFKNGVYFGYIYLHAVVSAPDPYDAVIRYNAVNGFVGSIIPFFENGFKVKRKDIYIGLDMNGEKSKAEFEVSASVRLRMRDRGRPCGRLWVSENSDKKQDTAYP